MRIAERLSRPTVLLHIALLVGIIVLVASITR